MKSNIMTITKYDADEGKVFDWADFSDHILENEDGTTKIDHLYAKTIFIGTLDSIDNYLEVEEPVSSL